MNEDYLEKNNINEAIRQLYRDFTEKYTEIQNSELPENEKKAKIQELVQDTTNAKEILMKAQRLSDISSEDKELLGIKEPKNPEQVDEDVIDILVSLYAERAKVPVLKFSTGVLDQITLLENEKVEDIDTTDFEREIREFFERHYAELLSVGYNKFLSDASKIAGDYKKENGELTEIAIKHGIDPRKFSAFGYVLTIQEGLVAEDDNILGRAHIFYGTKDAINKRIYDLYSAILFQYNVGNDRNNNDTNRKLKNAYISYAEENGIEIQDKVVLEEISVDMAKVQGIATYITRQLNKRGIFSSDMTASFAAEVIKNYSKIMNLSYYNFENLESVKKLLGDKFANLGLSINEDNITHSEVGIYDDIAYATPEYLKDEYAAIMAKIKELSNTDAFLRGEYAIKEANKQKAALRRYIVENGISGIDISIPEAFVDHATTEIIADALLRIYGKEYEDKAAMKDRILKKVESIYPEMISERQVMSVDDLIQEELRDMGQIFVMEDLIIQDDFVYLGQVDGYGGQVIFATPEAILSKIHILDHKISSNRLGNTYVETRQREQLEKYAKEQNFDIEIPSLESVKQKSKEAEELLKNRINFQSLFDRGTIPDDPTARPKLELVDTIEDMLVKMWEGIPGAMAAINSLMVGDNDVVSLLRNLDDMNIRGSQIWRAFEFYDKDGEKFAQAIRSRNGEMINRLNEEMAYVGGEKAVEGGASFDRSKDPSKYRFTEEEVYQLKIQKEERMQKQRAEMEKMIAESLVRKINFIEKMSETVSEKVRTFRERIAAKGQRSLTDLDSELTELTEKEKQAKDLYLQYDGHKQEQDEQEEL